MIHTLVRSEQSIVILYLILLNHKNTELHLMLAKNFNLQTRLLIFQFHAKKYYILQLPYKF